MTKPVLKLHINAPDGEKMEESSFDGHESMKVDEQDVKESDLDEDDIGVDDIEEYEDEETRSEQTEDSVSEVNESDDEYVPVGKKGLAPCSLRSPTPTDRDKCNNNKVF